MVFLLLMYGYLQLVKVYWQIALIIQLTKDRNRLPAISNAAIITQLIEVDKMELTLDKFMQLLCCDNLTEKIGIMGGRESDAIQENRCLMLKFLHENSVEYVYNRIEALSEFERNNVLTNVMSLYPLSQHLVRYILQNMPDGENQLVKGLDLGKQVCQTVAEILQKMRLNIPSDECARRFNDYDENIQVLEGEIAALDKKLIADKEAAEKKKRLESEKKRKEEELKNVSSLDKQIKDIENEIEDLNRQKQEKNAQLEEQNRKINKLRKEIEDNLKQEMDRLDNPQEKQLLRDLLKQFAKDEK